MQKVVTSNLNPLLKLFFYLPILTNNNLLFKIYCENIVVVFFNQDFLFFILFFFLSFPFHPYTFHFLFSFSCFSPLHKCPVSTPISIPPSFIFFFTSRTFQQPHLLHIKERERERLMLVHRPTAGGNRGCQKDKAGGDRRSPCSTTTSTAPPPLILLPTTKLVQIGLFFFSFFLFSYLLVLIQLYFKNWILFCVLCLDYVRNRENERKKRNLEERERIDKQQLV